MYLAGSEPGELQALNLTVTQAHVRQADVDRANASRESGDTKGEVSGAEFVVASQHEEDEESQLPRFEEAAGWVQIVNAPEGVDVAFEVGSGNRSTFLGEQTAPTGEYDEVGILIDEAVALDGQGNETEVRITDQAARTNASFTVDTDQETRIVLALDVKASLSEDEGDEVRFSPTFDDTRTQRLADEESGDEQHEQGEAADLAEQEG